MCIYCCVGADPTQKNAGAAPAPAPASAPPAPVPALAAAMMDMATGGGSPQVCRLNGLDSYLCMRCVVTGVSSRE
jgi:hypothetical protein